MVDSFLKMNVLYFWNGPYSILFKAKLFIVCKFIYFVHFIHTCLFINYYKTIALTKRQIAAKSSCSCSIKGTGQRRGDQPALRGPASVEGTGQRRGDQPASKGPASIKGTRQLPGAAAGSTNKPEPEKN